MSQVFGLLPTFQFAGPSAQGADLGQQFGNLVDFQPDVDPLTGVRPRIGENKKQSNFLGKTNTSFEDVLGAPQFENPFNTFNFNPLGGGGPANPQGNPGRTGLGKQDFANRTSGNPIFNVQDLTRQIGALNREQLLGIAGNFPGTTNQFQQAANQLAAASITPGFSRGTTERQGAQPTPSFNQNDPVIQDFRQPFVPGAQPKFQPTGQDIGQSIPELESAFQQLLQQLGQQRLL